MWFAAENVVLMGNPYVLKGSSPFAEYVVCRGKCGFNGESICFEGELSFRGICGLPRKMWFAAENVPYLLEGSSLANRWRGIFKPSLCFYIKGQCTQNHNEKETSLEI